MDKTSPTPDAERIGSLDVLRGLALFGVMSINLVMAFRVSIFQQFLGLSGGSAFDQWLGRFLSVAVEMKAFAVFSLLFGVGLAIQYERIGRREFPLRLLVRRLLVLLAFGLVHLCLIWNGDILTEYAIAGLVTLPFLFLGSRALLVGLLLCLVGRVVAALTVESPPTATLAEHVRQATDVYAHAGYFEYLRFSLAELRLMLPLHLSVFPRTVALFLIGMWAWRRGIVRNPARHKNLILVAGIVGTLLGFTLQESAPVRDVFSGLALTSAGPLAAALGEMALGLGYVAVAVYVFEFTPLRRLLSWAAPLGRMAFTNYIAQSVIFGLIFFGYGLGLFGSIGTAAALGIGLTVYILQVVGSRLWLHHYRLGPLEWLWRSLMYGRPQTMRCEPHLISASPT